METITGTAAGVPFTALPPEGDAESAAPLLVTWHMLDAPRTDAAFAAALPLRGVRAWRVHLGMPMCGARMVDGNVEAVLALARRDALTAFLAPFVEQATAEFPAALADLRARFPIEDTPIGILGASLGGAVALQVAATSATPIRAVALVNPAVRVGSAVPLVEPLAGHPYEWTPSSREVADRLDFVARVEEFSALPPTVIVSGERDHPEFRRDAEAFVAGVRARNPRGIDLVTVPDLGHPLAEEPGMEPAPQGPTAAAVDTILTRWFAERFRRS